MIIRGALDGASQQYLAVKADTLALPVTLENLIVQGVNATGTVGGFARSSYAVYVRSSDVTLERVDVIAGNGAPGVDGAGGTSASQTPAASGADGQSAEQPGASCSVAVRTGGNPGTQSCGGGTSTTGGKGGDGGAKDTECLGAVQVDGDARPGDVGADASVVTASLGGGGAAGGTCGSPSRGNGEPGREIHGAGGKGASSAGTLVGGFWAPPTGGNGTLGENGGGGGGGGGSGGCNSSEPDSRGAGGGGGGAGGCRASTAGKGGGGGGGSFGVFMVAADVTLIDVTIERGTGGAGGNGGPGGSGQPGGSGGKGGAAAGGSQSGGKGGTGGTGGHSGGGGGGAGGRSVGVFRLSGGSLTTIGAVEYVGGSGGGAGSGGQHPTYGPSSGTPGQPGSLHTVLVCDSC